VNDRLPGDQNGSRWELWNLQALDPGAGPADLEQLRRGRESVLQFEQAALDALAGGGEALLAPGRRFLRANPGISAGLVVSMHIGPYQFLPEPFLQAGLRPAVLLNRQAHAQLQARAEQLGDRLQLAGRCEWIPIDSPFFARKLVSALRAGRPVIVFLDGNGGWGGAERTREEGMPYRLPGREVRVRTGLGRLIRKLDCPVHPLVLRWDDTGGIIWTQGRLARWAREDNPEEITRCLYDWGFAEIGAAPEQWNYWGMLKASFTCFGPAGLTSGGLSSERRQSLREEFFGSLDRDPGDVRLELKGGLQIWPGDILADVNNDGFYSAEGLGESDLRFLREEAHSLAAVDGRYGAAWMTFHVLRLLLLGLARLKKNEHDR
jgi:hypothetical protein